MPMRTTNPPPRVIHLPQRRAAAERLTPEPGNRPEPASHDQRWNIGRSHRHQIRRHRLVAIAQRDQAVQRLGPDGLLHLNGQQVPVQHRGRLHQVFAQRHDRERQRQPARRQHPAPYRVDQRGQAQVAPVQVARGAGDPDQGPPPHRTPVPGGPQCRAVLEGDLVVAHEPRVTPEPRPRRHRPAPLPHTAPAASRRRATASPPWTATPAVSPPGTAPAPGSAQPLASPSAT